jgi:hypothetical protein
MYFEPGLVYKILLPISGAVFGSCLTAWWTSRRNQKDLCLKAYERWNGAFLSQCRKKAFKPLRTFFDPILSESDKYSNELVKLSELKYLSEPRANNKPAEYWSEEFIDDFLQVATFLCDLNKLMKSNLVDIRLSRVIFRDTILPWYKYFDKLEFDLSNEMSSKYLKSQIDSLYRFIK